MNVTIFFLNCLLTFCMFLALVSGLALHKKLTSSMTGLTKIKRNCSFALLQALRGCVIYSLLYIFANVRWMYCEFDSNLTNIDSISWIAVEAVQVMIIIKIYDLAAETTTQNWQRRKSRPAAPEVQAGNT